jgi:hypothetical protein
MVSEKVPEVVQLGKGRHVADVAGEVVLAGKGGNGLRTRHPIAEFVANQADENQRSNDDAAFCLLHGVSLPWLPRASSTS